MQRPIHAHAHAHVVQIVGPGGQSLFTTGGVTYLVYHYYTSTGSNLGINKLDFSSGWPVAV